MPSKYLISIVMMFALVAAVQVLTPQPQAEAESPLINEVIQAEVSTGPGFFPAPPKDEKTCTCGDFAALEKRVAALEAKCASYGSARPTASNGSAGNGSVGGSGQASVTRPPTTAGLPYGSTVISERTVSSRPSTPQEVQQFQMVTKKGLFGRTRQEIVPVPQAPQCQYVFSNGKWVQVCSR